MRDHLDLARADGGEGDALGLDDARIEVTSSSRDEDTTTIRSRRREGVCASVDRQREKFAPASMTNAWDEDLVGEGSITPEDGDRVPSSREVAVEGVGEGGDDEQRLRDEERVVRGSGGVVEREHRERRRRGGEAERREPVGDACADRSRVGGGVGRDEAESLVGMAGVGGVGGGLGGAARRGLGVGWYSAPIWPHESGLRVSGAS